MTEPGDPSAGHRASPLALAQRCDPGYTDPAHVVAMDTWLMQAVRGERRPNLIFEIPVRHGKSEYFDHWTPTWWLERDPTQQVILASNEAMFAAAWGRKVRDDIRRYQHLLTVRLRPDTTARDDWLTTAGGGMKTTGVGGSIEGRGAGLMILDDLIKGYSQAMSKTHRDAVWHWWENDASNRREPNCITVVLQARWHPDDHVGRMEREARQGGEEWDILTLPAVAEVPPQEVLDALGIDATEYRDPLGREPGEPLWPERWPLEAMAPRMKRRASWAARWQQRPEKARATVIPRDWWIFCEPQDVPRDATVRRHWDLAGTEEEEGADPDKTAGVKLAGKDGIRWVMDYRGWMKTPHGNELAIRQTADEDGPAVVVGINKDPGQAGKSQVDHYRRRVLRGYAVEEYTETGPKEVRWRPTVAGVQAGNYRIVRGHWNEEFIAACEDPSEYDDPMDAFVNGDKMLGEEEDQEDADLW